MPFSLTRPSTPTRDPHTPGDEHHSASLPRALQDQLNLTHRSTTGSTASVAGTNAQAGPSSLPLHSQTETMPSSLKDSLSHQQHHHIKEKDVRPRLEIVLDNEPVVLRGTGAEVEPTRLSGHVALYLSESTSIKEITLQFRGKARIPTHNHDSLSLSSSTSTYVICNHQWSFLEGERKHSHTLKAGHHVFPFHLDVGGSLPSSIYTHAFHGNHASLSYKFRAHAVRPGLSHNLQCVLPVTILRSFTSEALEYQQTLEIENTWPEKLMYSLMIPHKAWAAGDSVHCIAKFQPLLKGVRVLSITTSIQESIKLYKGGSGSMTWSSEYTKNVAQVKHAIEDGKAVEVTGRTRSGYSSGLQTPATPAHGTTYSVSSPMPSSSSHARGGDYFGPNPHASSSAHDPTTIVQEASLSSSSSSSIAPSTTTGLASVDDLDRSVLPYELEPSQDVSTRIKIQVPLASAPTHLLDPINVTHRIRWSILISNPDGHTSELRCSLPLHVLDWRLLGEAKSHTAATRRILLGMAAGVDGDADDTAEGGDASWNGAAGGTEEEEASRELPSYHAHVRDRIANQFLTDRNLARVENPWVVFGFSPTLAQPVSTSTGHSTPGWASPVYIDGQGQPGAGGRHLPHAPPPPESGAGGNPLDWVNSELLLSLRSQPGTPNAVTNAHSSEQSSHHGTPPAEMSSPSSSRAQSRRPSRPASPDRLGPLTASSGTANAGATAAPTATSSGTYVHGESLSNRQTTGLFSASMKPVSSLNHSSWHFPSGGLGLRSNPTSYTNLAALTGSGAPGGGSHSAGPGSTISHTAIASSGHTHARYQSLQRGDSYSHSREGGGGSLSASENQEALHRAFTDVPDYGIAARGWLGGVTPLETMRGLPSYEDAQRVRDTVATP